MDFDTFLRFLIRTAPNRPDLHFLIYTRKACPLCDEAHGLLARYQVLNGFTLELVDVDTSEELCREHGNCVPVVLVNGKVRFRGHVNDVLLQRILDAAPPEETQARR